MLKISQDYQVKKSSKSGVKCKHPYFYETSWNPLTYNPQLRATGLEDIRSK